jgi:hypothetical protein
VSEAPDLLAALQRSLDMARRELQVRRAEAERRDTERIRSELLDRLDAGGPEFAEAVARNLTINAAASQLDAIAEAINEETR